MGMWESEEEKGRELCPGWGDRRHLRTLRQVRRYKRHTGAAY